jgi:hypothetical protein
MNRAVARHWPAAPPQSARVPPPAHVGQPLQVGEQCLLRRVNDWFDVIVELRAIDRDVALVLVRDSFEIVQLASLRRSLR